MLPRRFDSWETIEEFALTYDGYSYWDDVAQMAKRCYATFIREGNLPCTIDEIRGCVFYEQRRWHLASSGPSERSLEFTRALLNKLQDLLTERESHRREARPRRGLAS